MTKAGIAHPPGKDILFNKNLTKSDGLLERAIADKSQIAFEDAGVILRNIVESYWSKLNGGDKVKFNRIGVLYIDDHKNLRFEPSANENFLKSSFGFESFVLPPRVEPIAVSAQSLEQSSSSLINEEPEVIKLKTNRNIYWVAAAVMLPFVAMSLYLGIATNFKSPTEITLAELIPSQTTKTEKRKYNPNSEQRINSETGKASIISFPSSEELFKFSFEKNEIDSLGVWVDLTPTEEAEEGGAEQSATTVNGGLYHIIAGCFGEKDNAQKFIHQLQSRGYEASILDYHKRLYRVRVESFDNFSTAVSTLESMRNDGSFPNAWLLKKRVS